MSDKKIIDLLRIFLDNRVAKNETKSKIIVDNSDYDRAQKFIDKYDEYMLLDIQKKELEEKQMSRDVKKNIEKTEEKDLILFSYTERSFILLGNTKKYKDKLITIGGRFNPLLNHPITGEKVQGWIFSNRKLEIVEKEFNLKK